MSTYNWLFWVEVAVCPELDIGLVKKKTAPSERAVYALSWQTVIMLVLFKINLCTHARMYMHVFVCKFWLDKMFWCHSIAWHDRINFSIYPRTSYSIRKIMGSREISKKSDWCTRRDWKSQSTQIAYDSLWIMDILCIGFGDSSHSIKYGHPAVHGGISSESSVL